MRKKTLQTHNHHHHHNKSNYLALQHLFIGTDSILLWVKGDSEAKPLDSEIASCWLLLYENVLISLYFSCATIK